MAKLYARALRELSVELDKSIQKLPKLHSAHQAYAKTLEELDEVWCEVRRKPGKRRPKKLKRELIQVAAMALRFWMEACE